MSIYEIKLKNDYVEKGYRFLSDIIAESADEAVKCASFKHRIPNKKILCLQGECIAFNSTRKRGLSRWLLFEKPYGR